MGGWCRWLEGHQRPSVLQLLCLLPLTTPTPSSMAYHSLSSRCSCLCLGRALPGSQTRAHGFWTVGQSDLLSLPHPPTLPPHTPPHTANANQGLPGAERALGRGRRQPLLLVPVRAVALQQRVRCFGCPLPPIKKVSCPYRAPPTPPPNTHPTPTARKTCPQAARSSWPTCRRARGWTSKPT